MYFKSLDNPSHDVKDVVIVSVPWVDTHYSLMAPAVLKPVVEKAGFSCLALDINGEFRKLAQAQCNNSEQISDVIKFFYENHCNQESEILLLNLFSQLATQIVSFRPKFVGLSALAYPCKNSIRWIAYFVKHLDPSIKIIIGGAGVIGTNFTGRSEFVDELIASGVVDYHIRGDGEHSLYELLKGNTEYVGINSLHWQELSNEDLTKLPTPDYSNYHFEFYEKKHIGLLGSRGCVRSCTYCDYIENWKKFTWRTADDVFYEMKHQNQKHGIQSFMFQDALVNGNLKEFNRLIEMIADYNDKNPTNAFQWSGMYIFRDVTATSEKEWENLAKSGAFSIPVGIENLNEHIRYHMGKKFSNKSLEFHLEQAAKHKLKVVFLMIVGYVTETQKDIEFAKQWLIDNIRFKDTIEILWGSTLGILENTYLVRNEKQLGIKIHALGTDWVNESINNTPKLRATWAKELVKFSQELGYTVIDNLHNHYVLDSLIHAKD